MTKLLLLLFAATSLLLGACTSKVNEGLPEASTIVATAAAACKGTACAVCDLPWGGQLASGQSNSDSFSKNLAECSESCDSFKIKLSCVDGQLKAETSSGVAFNLISSLSKTCYKKRCDCNYAGRIVEDGKALNFFRSATAACGTKCESRSFDCRSGKLVDTASPTTPSTIANYSKGSCTEAACRSCTTPWGVTVPHLGTIPAYNAEIGACGTTCEANKAVLTCKDGQLSGADLSQYKFATCTARACQSCVLGSGDMIAHGKSATGYSINSAPCGVSCETNSKVLSCNDGVIQGGDPNVFKFNTCTPIACVTCQLPCGTTLGHGGKGYCFKASQPAACGQTCLAERKEFGCQNGVTTAADNTAMTANAAYTQTSCAEQAACSACTIPGGKQILDGTKVTLYKTASLGCGKSCFTTDNAITLTCSNGSIGNQALYKDFKETNCAVDCRTVEGDAGLGRVNGDGGGAPVHLCLIPWGAGWATHNSTFVAFSMPNAPAGHKCSEYKAQITCNSYRGLWSGGGTYVYPTCVDSY